MDASPEWPEKECPKWLEKEMKTAPRRELAEMFAWFTGSRPSACQVAMSCIRVAALDGSPAAQRTCCSPGQMLTTDLHMNEFMQPFTETRDYHGHVAYKRGVVTVDMSHICCTHISLCTVLSLFRSSSVMLFCLTRNSSLCVSSCDRSDLVCRSAACHSDKPGSHTLQSPSSSCHQRIQRRLSQRIHPKLSSRVP